MKKTKTQVGALHGPGKGQLRGKDSSWCKTCSFQPIAEQQAALLRDLDSMWEEANRCELQSMEKVPTREQIESAQQYKLSIRGPFWKPESAYLTNEGYPLGTTCWFFIAWANGLRKICCGKTPEDALKMAIHFIAEEYPGTDWVGAL
jgi:hypothetical protein